MPADVNEMEVLGEVVRLDADLSVGGRSFSASSVKRQKSFGSSCSSQSCRAM